MSNRVSKKEREESWRRRSRETQCRECFKCWCFLLLTLVIAGFFFYDMIRDKIKEKQMQHKARSYVYVDPFTKHLDLSLTGLEYTLARPLDYELADFYTNFTYILPEEFLDEGNPVI